MPCNVVRYLDQKSGKIGWGVHEDSIYPIKGSFATTKEFLQSGKQLAFAMKADLAKHADNRVDPASVEILSPVTKPCQVLCQGANYRQHMIESGMNPDEKKFNMIFNKSAACITAADGDIVRPSHVKLLDYEIELGLIIGSQVEQSTDIGESDLHKYVAAIVIGNDVSARDIQVPQMQFFKGKSYRTFCPVGPYLCLMEPDDFKYLNDLDLRLTVNGETRQKASTEELVFKPAEALSELSQIADLNVGDLILTGTPAGCAMQVPPAVIVKIAGLLSEAKKWKIFVTAQAKRPEYLQPGDMVEARISSADGVIDLGVQRNTIVAG